MTRKAAREIAVQLVYNMSFNDNAEALLEERLGDEIYSRLSQEDELYEKFPDEEQKNYITRVAEGVAEHMAELDGYIEKYSVGWKFGRLPLMAVATMRVAMFEVLYMPDIPNAAAINEAVEISKKYEPKEITAFINGILGAFSRGEPV